MQNMRRILYGTRLVGNGMSCSGHFAVREDMGDELGVGETVAESGEITLLQVNIIAKAG